MMFLHLKYVGILVTYLSSKYKKPQVILDLPPAFPKNAKFLCHIAEPMVAYSRLGRVMVFFLSTSGNAISSLYTVSGKLDDDQKGCIGLWWQQPLCAEESFLAFSCSNVASIDSSTSSMYSRVTHSEP